MVLSVELRRTNCSGKLRSSTVRFVEGTENDDRHSLKD